jgi:predicted membrane channel-forming protein YqfA (hemolysin III family)
MFKQLSGLAGRVIGYEVIVVGVVGAFCLVRGWHSTGEISEAFWVAGIFILAVGAAVLVGGPSRTRNVETHLVRTVSLTDDERARQDKREKTEGSHEVWQGMILGGLTIGIAIIVNAL